MWSGKKCHTNFPITKAKGKYYMRRHTIYCNHYTEKEDVSAGDVIVSCLGDADGEKAEVRKGSISGFDGVVHINQLVELFEK